MSKNQKKCKNKPTLFSYLKHEKFLIAGYIATEIVGNIGTVISTVIIAECLTFLTESAFSMAINYFLIYAFIRVIRRCSFWLGCKFIYSSATRLSFRIRKDLIERTFKLKSKTFTDTSSGLFVTRVVEDSREVFDKINQIIEGVAYIFSGAITVAYIAILNVWIGLIFAVSIIGLSILETYRKKVGKALGKKAKESTEEIVALTTEIVRSEKDIKALNLDAKLKEQCIAEFEENKKKTYRRDMVDAHLWNFRSLLVDLIMCFVVVFAIYTVAGGVMAAASMLFIFMNRDMFFDLIWYIGHISKKITECKICTERMFEIFDEEKFPSESFGDENLEVCRGEIEFKNVSFAYEDTFSGEEEPKDYSSRKKKTEEPKKKEYVQVFENLSFKIPANKTVAFVGKSGSGKSTILSLMSKMYEVDSGEVLLDGVNINLLSKQSIRANLSLVNQFPYIFNTSIKKNLLLAKKDATEEEIYDACKRAAFLPFVKTLKRGIDTKVGEGGIKLSGGQKQRLAIARALLRGSKIILFDESTSSLDNFAQEEIKESINALSGGNTVVIVAHRLSTIKNADKIFFLDSGKICGEGTFEELFNNNEMFRAMFETENI